MIGALSGLMDSAPDMFGLIGKNLTLKGITAGSRAMLADLLALVAEKNIEPLVEKSFAFDDASAAVAYLDSGGHMGKVMIAVP